MVDLRRDGIIIVDSIQRWRSLLAEADAASGGGGLVRLADGSTVPPHMTPYIWRGSNYVYKMLRDLDFVAEAPEVVRAPPRAG